MTPDQIHATTPSERLQMFDTLARAVYGSDRYHSALAADLEIKRQTVHAWKKNPASIPVAVLLLLSEWDHRQNLALELEQLAASLRLTSSPPCAETPPASAA